MTPKEITLTNNTVVLADDYIEAKTRDLQDFGYSTITQDEVRAQVIKILNKESDLSVIGHFCKGDIKL